MRTSALFHPSSRAQRNTSAHFASRRDASLLSICLAAVNAHLQRQKDQRHLERLPDYLLKDIGLSRRDVCRHLWKL